MAFFNWATPFIKSNDERTQRRVKQTEEDFLRFCEKHGQTGHFRFESEILMVIPVLLMIDSCELVDCLGDDEKLKFWKKVESRPHDSLNKLKKSTQSQVYAPEKMGGIFRHLRNALAHNNYYLENNRIKFWDQGSGGNEMSFCLKGGEFLQVCRDFIQNWLHAAEAQWPGAFHELE